MRSRGVSGVFRRAATRTFGIAVATVLSYSSAPYGINSALIGFEKLVKAEIAKHQRYGGTERGPGKARHRASSIGRTPNYRGGINNVADVAQLMRNEQSRLVRRARENPDLLLANINPLLPPGGPTPTPVGDPEIGEGSAGGTLGVGFSDMHEGGTGPKPADFLDTGNGWCDYWSPGMGIPCFWPGGSGNGGGSGTGGLGTGGGVESRVGLNTNTGNMVSAVPITGWSARGDSYVGFQLIHNSMQTNTLGAITDMGHSWTHSYSIEVNYTVPMPLSPPSSGDVMYLIWMDGQRIKFSYDGIDAIKGYRFKAPAGYHAYIYTDLAASFYNLETKDQWLYEFNDDGYLIQQTDAWDNEIDINRNGSNEITTVSDNTTSTARTLTFTYSAGKITKVKAPDNQEWTFTRNFMTGDLTKVTYPDLNSSSYDIDFTYNSDHDILTFTNKLGKAWTYTYSTDSELTSAKNPLNKQWGITYATNKVTITNPDWEYIEHHYASGRITDFIDEAGWTVSFSADSDENLTQVVDKKGKIWNWDYDTNGNMLSVEDPTGLESHYTYNSDNNLITTKNDASTTVMTLDYDNGYGVDLPSPTSVDDALYNAVSYVEYDSLGEVQTTGYTIASVDYPKASFTYNDQGDVLTVTQSGTSISSSATYDIMGRAETVTDTASETTDVYYDDWGRAESMELPDASTVSLSVNEGGQITSATDQLSRSGYVSYNDAGYVTSTENAEGEVTEYGYDDIGRVEWIENARNKKRFYDYTERHELWRLTRPGSGGQVETWGYDPNGNIDEYLPYIGSYKIEYTFDDAGRPLTVDYPTGTDTTFGYDTLGRSNSMVDATGTSSWVYNLLGQVTSLTTPQGSFTYNFDSDKGRPTTTVDVNGTWTALYDTYDRAYGSTNPWSETTTVTFDNAGRVNKKTLPNGMYEEYTFDMMSRPTYIKTYNSSSVLQDTKQYVWDAASRVTSAVEGGLTTSYMYDDIDQLLTEVKTALSYSASYTYDANGNRLTRTVGVSTETYAYSDDDKLLSITGGSNPRTFTYDDQGRTDKITAGLNITSFTYDYDGRATSITYPALTSDTFTYNGAGARVSSAGVNGSKTFRRAGIGATSSVLGDGTKSYTPGVSSRQGSTSTFQHSGLKNATDQTDSSQTVTASRHYDAFGNVINSSGTWQGPFGYAGNLGYQEDGNGLKLLGHRYYDSNAGRFMTSDPIGDGSNWYAYAGSNPVTNADPDGFKLVGNKEFLQNMRVLGFYLWAQAVSFFGGTGFISLQELVDRTTKGRTTIAGKAKAGSGPQLPRKGNRARYESLLARLRSKKPILTPPTSATGTRSITGTRLKNNSKNPMKVPGASTMSKPRVSGGTSAGAGGMGAGMLLEGLLIMLQGGSPLHPANYGWGCPYYAPCECGGTLTELEHGA